MTTQLTAMNHNNNNYTSNSDRTIVIMAGGSGTRMGSSLPKQLLTVGNKPMIMHLIDNAHQIKTNIILIVSSKNRNVVLNTLQDGKHISYISHNEYFYKGSLIQVCEQPVANGTGGALMATSDILKTKNSNDLLLVLSADVPLISKKTMLNMFDQIDDSENNCVILAKDTKNNFGCGRIILQKSVYADNDYNNDNNDYNNDQFVKIVEEKDCNDDEQLITLINTGTYVFRVGPLLESFQHLNNENAQKEYYLTDCPKYINNMYDKCSVKIVTINDHFVDYDETLGANTPEQLAQLKIEYSKKFSIERIEGSNENMTDYNLKNLMRILEQLSSTKFSFDINNMDTYHINRVRRHIQDNIRSVVNKKHLFIVKYEDTIVGTGSVLVEEKLIHDFGLVAHIEDVVIDEDYRGLGLAKRLMETLIRCSIYTDCYKIILDASDDVKAFYEKL